MVKIIAQAEEGRETKTKRNFNLKVSLLKNLMNDDYCKENHKKKNESDLILIALFK